jgi:ABC-type uncharacterized transport system ATPase component
LKSSDTIVNTSAAIETFIERSISSYQKASPEPTIMSNPPIIAVIGVTGAGKSTFINTASGKSDHGVGYGIDSCR